MPGWWDDLASKPELIGLVVILAIIFAAGAVALRKYLGGFPTAEETERRRRKAINRVGKLRDGEVIDIDGATVVYSYQVAGVGYTAVQDVSTLESSLPSDRMSMIGPASVKIDPRNPANSILLCEEWSGLRDRETQSRLA